MNAPTATRTDQSRLANLLASDRPAIAVSFADQISSEDLDRARSEGLDVAELRIDRYSSWEIGHVVDTVKRFGQFPTIATIRTATEGGQWDGTDRDRLALFRAVLPHVDGVDVELSSRTIVHAVVEEARAQGKVVIISNHNFDETPSSEELNDMATSAKALGADVVKLSAFAHSPEDIQRLAAFTIDQAELGLIVIGMGAHGSVSRVFFPALGSKLTYAHHGNWVVSGQLDFEETFQELRRFYPTFNEAKVVELQLIENH